MHPQDPYSPVTSLVMLWMMGRTDPRLICWWHKTQRSGWYAKELHCHPEGTKLSHLGRKRLSGIIPMHINTWRKGAKRTETDFFQWCPVSEPETINTIGKTAEHQKTLFYREWLCPGTGAQGSYGVSILWHSQKPSGHGHGWWAVDGPFWAGWLNQVT